MYISPFRNLFPRHFVLIIITLIMWIPCSFSDCDWVTRNWKEIPPQPKGYYNETLLKAAFVLKQLPLIDAEHVPVPAGVQEVTDIIYGKIGNRELKLDLYVPTNRKAATPAIIFIHGGAWKSGDRKIMKFYCARFAALGYVTATISYRFSGEALFPAAVLDTKCAVRWVRSHAKDYLIDPDKIAVSGNSAGGHLSMMAGFSSDVTEWETSGGNEGVSSRVQAVINFYGPVDFTTEFARTQAVVPLFLGKTYEQDPELYKKVSPLTYITPDDPPVLTLHGTIDSTVPIDQVDILEKALTAKGVPHQTVKFEGWPHTMDLAKVVNDRCLFLMDTFLCQYLPLPK